MKTLRAMDSFVKSLTIEPAVFALLFGLTVQSGSQVTQNLVIWKVKSKGKQKTPKIIDISI